MSFGNSIQSRVTGVLAQGAALDGRRVTVSNVAYSSEIAGQGDHGVSVDVGGDSVIGFTTLADAKQYLHSWGDQEYQTFDNMGRKTTVTRAGLGIPTGMISWANSATSGATDAAPAGPTGATGASGTTGSTGSN